MVMRPQRTGGDDEQGVRTDAGRRWNGDETRERCVMWATSIVTSSAGA